MSGLIVTNKQADFSENRYNNELAKAGIYSFFAAFRNNELAYKEFYRTIAENEAFGTVKAEFSKKGDSFVNPSKYEIFRNIKNSDSLKFEQRPNIIFICIESLSGKYLNTLGSELNITPTLDSLANQSIFFTNLFATGTRTVRGMEAITLSIPPTPGRSIVKRKNNTGLFTIGEVFKEKGYDRNFFYGGDGYFDNMNTYFGGNGFNIIDRGRGFLLDKRISTTRTNIEDDEVTFENAWGVCDEDIYRKVIKEADNAYQTGKPFFDFVMTTSNHKPYTYPEGKIDIPSGTGRNGAIKYTDYAIGEFLKTARTKPWFTNTVFVIMSDHCASSAGRWELDVENYHIPALIYNLPNMAQNKISKLCSQIDMFPTLFGLLGWDYTSNLFGMDILQMNPDDERAFIGNYRKLGLLKEDKVMILGDQKSANFYQWKSSDNSLKSVPMDNDFLRNTISWYQVSDYLYINNGLKAAN
ncbi:MULTISPECIES: LTA synthase family protein [unclassified Arenibacter]|uniref:LTA synthase family protein n=1 Tax=unclassified Arenibacter TaxID=2615047 RepID=UPI00286899B2|nr:MULTISPECIES: LTA synthase family protein [unclassified Arenibacter]